MKRCSACRTSKPVEEFYRNSAQPDGYGNNCKVCANTKSRESAKRHPDRVRRNMKAYLARHPEVVEKMRERERERKAANPEPHRREALDRYYAEHPNQPCVYFVGMIPLGSGPVKIGHTCNLPRRLATIQNGSPYLIGTFRVEHYATKRDACRAERALRKRFAHLNIHREWFRAEPELVERILNTEEETA